MSFAANPSSLQTRPSEMFLELGSLQETSRPKEVVFKPVECRRYWRTVHDELVLGVRRQMTVSLLAP